MEREHSFKPWWNSIYHLRTYFIIQEQIKIKRRDTIVQPSRLSIDWQSLFFDNFEHNGNKFLCYNDNQEVIETGEKNELYGVNTKGD